MFPKDYVDIIEITYNSHFSSLILFLWASCYFWLV